MTLVYNFQTDRTQLCLQRQYERMITSYYRSWI